ncbi:MAG: hypothetical protein U5S82_16990 [Gammaproteobacteria bacterium]|nr:hypothetical protein [Gammaproteobacteria bacterium]
MNRPFLLATVGTMLSLIASPSWAADPGNTPSGNTTTSATLLERTPLTKNERARAGIWGLSLDEWQRYRTLMEGIRGSISPGTISPIEVLGIHARDEAERRRYAEQWAVMMVSARESAFLQRGLT